MAVFPYLGSYSGVDHTSYRQTLHEYDDNTYRLYKKSAAKHRIIDIPFTNISKTKRDAIEAFFNTNFFLTFTLYVWPEAQPSDLAGLTGTGAHTARFADAPMEITNNSTCSYSLTLSFVLLS